MDYLPVHVIFMHNGKLAKFKSSNSKITYIFGPMDYMQAIPPARVDEWESTNVKYIIIGFNHCDLTYFPSKLPNVEPNHIRYMTYSRSERESPLIQIKDDDLIGLVYRLFINKI